MTALFFRILALSLAITPIILLLWLLARCFGARFSAACRYRVWGVVMLSLCICTCLVSVPTVYTLYLPQDVKTAETESLDDKAVSSAEIGEGTRDEIAISSGTVDVVQTKESGETIPFAPIETEPLVSPIVSVEPETVERVAEGEERSFLPVFTVETVLLIFSYVWLGGAMIYFGVHLLTHLSQTAAYDRQKVLCEPQITSIYTALCHKLGIKKAPQLYRAANAESPLIYGFFRPTVLLPEIELSPNAAVGVLAHELTHHKRGDLWQKFFCLVATSLYWFHPLVYLASKRFHAEMELSCDEKVLDGMSEAARRSYGNVMLDIVKRCRHNAHSLTTRFDPHTSAVKERFMNILDMTKKRRGILIVICAVALCLLAGTVIGCKWESEKQKESDTTVTDTEKGPSAIAGETPSGEVYLANYNPVSMEEYAHLDIPTENIGTVRDVFTKEGLLSVVGEEYCIFADVDRDGKDEVIVRFVEHMPNMGLWDRFRIYDVKEGILCVTDMPELRGIYGGEYNPGANAFMLYGFESGGAKTIYEAMMIDDAFYVKVKNGDIGPLDPWAGPIPVGYENYRVSAPIGAAEGEVYTGYLVDYTFTCSLYPNETYRFLMQLPQIHTEKTGAGAFNAAICNRYFYTYAERIRALEHSTEDASYRLDLSYEVNEWDGVSIITMCSNGVLLGTGGAHDTYDMTYYDRENDELLSLDTFVRRYTKDKESLLSVIAKLNDALFSNYADEYRLTPNTVYGIIPVDEESYYVIYMREPVEGTFADVALVTGDSVKWCTGRPSDVVFKTRRYRILNEQYRAFMRGERTFEALLSVETVRYNAASCINEILNAYRTGRDVSELLPAPDPSGDYFLPKGVSVRSDLGNWEIAATYRKGDFGHKFTILLDVSKNIKLDLYFGVGGFGESTELYFKKCDIYTTTERIVSQFAGIEEKDIVFGNQLIVGTELYLYGVQDGDTMRIISTKDDETFRSTTVTVPNEWKNGKNELAFAKPGGGSGDMLLYVKHTDQDGVTYLQFDNSKGLYNVGKAEHTKFSYVGEADYMTLTSYAHFNDIEMPCVNIPHSADSVEELSCLGLEENDLRDDLIEAFVRGDGEKMELLCGVKKENQGMYTDLFKTFKVAKWYAYTDEDERGVHVKFRYATKNADGTLTWSKPLLSVEGWMGMYFEEEYDIHGFQGGNWEEAAYRLFANSKLCELPQSDDMSDVARWHLTCYICSRITTAEKHATLAEMQAYAKTYFGIERFTPDATHKIGDKYGEVGHGGASQVLDIIGSGIKDGVYSVTIQYYADASKLVKSHVYTYHMKQHVLGDGSDASNVEWGFIDYEVVTRAKYEPYGLSM